MAHAVASTVLGAYAAIPHVTERINRSRLDQARRKVLNILPMRVSRYSITALTESGGREPTAACIPTVLECN